MQASAMAAQEKRKIPRSTPTSKLRWLNRVRLATLVLVFLFILVLPVLGLYQSYTAAHAIEWMEGGEKAFFDTLHTVVSWFSDDPAEDLDFIKGSVWSAKIGGFKISDPLGVVGQILAEQRVYWPFVLSALVPVVLTILLGRFFCGWICPGYLLYEIGDLFRQLLYRAGLRPRNIKLPLPLKYAVLGVGLVGGAVLGVALFPMVYPPAVISREIYYKVYYGAFGSGLTLLAITLVLEAGFPGGRSAATCAPAVRSIPCWVRPGWYAWCGNRRPASSVSNATTCAVWDCNRCRTVPEWNATIARPASPPAQPTRSP